MKTEKSHRKRMEEERKKASSGDGRDRLKKAQKPVFDRTILPPAGLVAKDPPPQPKLKHQAYFEFVENTNKKKQLEYQVDSHGQQLRGFNRNAGTNIQLFARR